MAFTLTDILLFGSAATEDSGTLRILRNQILQFGATGRAVEVVVKGVSPLVLPDAIANSLSYVKAFGGTEQRNLPAGYTQLEYIQSSGSQYIDTGRVPNNDDIIEQKFQKVGSSDTTCAWYGSMPSSLIITPRIGIGTYSSQGVASMFAGSNYTGNIGVADTNVHTLRFQATGQTELTYTLDGVTDVIDASTSPTPPDMYEPAVELTSYLFARHGTNGVQVYDNEGTKIYYHREYLANGTLMLDMVPVKRNSDNVLGMYDFVSGQFFTNQGTGDFVAGSETVPTPDAPMDIVSNNGVLKYSRNKTNVIADNIEIGKYISAQGAVTDSVSNFIYKTYIPVKPNTTYTLGLSEELYYVTISEYTSADDSGFVVRTAGSTGGNTSLTITTGPTTQYIRWGSNPYGNNNTVTWEQIQAINFMLTETAAPLPYAPYVSDNGGIYTDGTVETINVHGKNLFDKSTVSTVAPNTLRSDFIRVVPGAVYSMSTRGASVIIEYDSEQTQLRTLYIGGTTYTPNADAVFAKFNLMDTYLNTFQIERGSTATDYQPYFDGGTATAEMLLKVGDYQDVQSILDGAVTRNVGVLVLDGTENWQLATATNLVQFYTSRTQGVVATSVSLTSTIAPYGCTAATRAQYDFGCYSGNSGNLCFQMKGSATLTTVPAWTQYLTDQYNAGTPVIVVYPLATPTTESVTGQTLQVTGGDNVLEITQASLNNLELEAKYMKQGS